MADVAVITFDPEQLAQANGTDSRGKGEFYELYGEDHPASALMAWAWGVSRCIDYFETDKTVDAKRVAITGASRLGKTVLWAAAQDERAAAVFAVVPGEMGASLIRRDWGETLDDMAQNFPWQFAGNLQKWVGRWDELPVDQHMLIALCAPRPTFVVDGGASTGWPVGGGSGGLGGLFILLLGGGLGSPIGMPLGRLCTGT